MFIYQATVLRVVDGDTLDLQLDLGFGVFTCQRVRLLGVNAAEHGTELGDKATAFVKAWVAEHGPTFTVRTQKDKREKYGRYLATVLSSAEDLGQALIDAGLAVAYDGTGPRPVPEPVR
ncbi:thermonuclease family protein [Streptomyces sp. NPDC021080]|uniref:thermonuclease family protein n=1 Tax=Streptomyces sp. NPDC021080 TaxID=3365110 RepID=UPI0037A88C68